jgi:GNAT superfamily N-acetyltransferase
LQSGEGQACEKIMRALPEWFGIPESIVAYARAAEMWETCVAVRSGAVIGFLTLQHHNSQAAEIHVMAVAKEHHGHGVGRRLVEWAERSLTARAIEYLQVKTLGPSRPNESYARTRGFYAHLGFVPLEENNLWGDVNPCLILVKHLRCSGGRLNARRHSTDDRDMQSQDTAIP